MRTRDEIKEIYKQFIEIIRDNKISNLKNISSEILAIDFSTVGVHHGFPDVGKALTWNQERINVRRAKTCNIVIHHRGDAAVMSAYAYFLFAYDKNPEFYPWEYGGKFVLKLSHDSSWKIDKIYFDLDWEKGNNYFVKDWILMDHTICYGHRPSIVSQEVSPWAEIPIIDDDRTEEEVLKEVIAQYAMGEDTYNFDLLEQTICDDIISIMPHNVQIKNISSFMEFAKKVRMKEAAFEHMLCIMNIAIDGDKASMMAYRLEPHRLGNKVLTRYNVDTTFYSAIYEIDLVKQNDSWKIKRDIYTNKIFSQIESRNEILID